MAVAMLQAEQTGAPEGAASAAAGEATLSPDATPGRARSRTTIIKKKVRRPSNVRGDQVAEALSMLKELGNEPSTNIAAELEESSRKRLAEENKLAASSDGSTPRRRSRSELPPDLLKFVHQKGLQQQASATSSPQVDLDDLKRPSKPIKPKPIQPAADPPEPPPPVNTPPVSPPDSSPNTSQTFTTRPVIPKRSDVTSPTSPEPVSSPSSSPAVSPAVPPPLKGVDSLSPRYGSEGGTPRSYTDDDGRRRGGSNVSFSEQADQVVHIQAHEVMSEGSSEFSERSKKKKTGVSSSSADSKSEMGHESRTPSPSSVSGKKKVVRRASISPSAGNALVKKKSIRVKKGDGADDDDTKTVILKRKPSMKKSTSAATEKKKKVLDDLKKLKDEGEDDKEDDDKVKANPLAALLAGNRDDGDDAPKDKVRDALTNALAKRFQEQAATKQAIATATGVAESGVDALNRELRAETEMRRKEQAIATDKINNLEEDLLATTRRLKNAEDKLGRVTEDKSSLQGQLLKMRMELAALNQSHDLEVDRAAELERARDVALTRENELRQELLWKSREWEDERSQLREAQRQRELEKAQELEKERQWAMQRANEREDHWSRERQGEQDRIKQWEDEVQRMHERERDRQREWDEEREAWKKAMQDRERMRAEELVEEERARARAQLLSQREQLQLEFEKDRLHHQREYEREVLMRQNTEARHREDLELKEEEIHKTREDCARVMDELRLWESRRTQMVQEEATRMVAELKLRGEAHIAEANKVLTMAQRKAEAEVQVRLKQKEGEFAELAMEHARELMAAKVARNHEKHKKTHKDHKKSKKHHKDKHEGREFDHLADQLQLANHSNSELQGIVVGERQRYEDHLVALRHELSSVLRTSDVQSRLDNVSYQPAFVTTNSFPAGSGGPTTRYTTPPKVRNVSYLDDPAAALSMRNDATRRSASSGSNSPNMSGTDWHMNYALKTL